MVEMIFGQFLAGLLHRLLPAVLSHTACRLHHEYAFYYVILKMVLARVQK